MLRSLYNHLYHYTYHHEKKFFVCGVNRKEYKIIMKILVVSDSHLYGDYLHRVTELYKNKVDLMVHCGDSSLSLYDSLIYQYNLVVQGNHDDAPFAKYLVYQDICVTHGHFYNVYYGYEDLIKLCQQLHCHICFHGHTHVPTHQIHQGIHFINPGSLMMNRGSYGYGTYAIVERTNQHLLVTYYHHQTDQPIDKSILSEGLELLDEFKQILK